MGIEDKYEAAVGPEALARQKQAAQDYHICCGEWKAGPHHEACKNYVPDQVEIQGQEKLL